MSNVKFVDDEHEHAFQALANRIKMDYRNREYVLLVYLLSVVDPKQDHFDDLLKIDNYGHVIIHADVLNHAWVTESDKKLIRLAFHCFSWMTPTVKYGDEVDSYTPLSILSGLDPRRTKAVLEAIQMLCYFYY